jgi:cobalt-zinc-cadmium efflux system membrane fusion protein
MTRYSIFAAFVLVACGHKEEPAPAPVPSPVASNAALSVDIDPSLFVRGRVRLGPVTRGEGIDTRALAGEVISDERGRAESGVLTAGRVVSLEVDVGSRVRRGDVLAWVDAPEVARVSAEVVRAKARAELSAKKEARQKTLSVEGATSQNAVDEASAESAIAKADLSAAEGLLRSLGGSGGGGRVAVRSPIDGTVSKRHGVLGAAISPDTALFEIVKQAPRMVVAKVPEGAAFFPEVGGRARVRPRGATDENGQGCGAVVRGDLGAVESETRTRGFRVEVDEACPWLVVGAFVRVDLGAKGDAPRTAKPTIPRDALIELKGATGVFVRASAEGAGPLLFRPVRTEPGSGESVAISEGLREGENVVVVGAPLVKSELLRAELHE